jgi:hypothetical protein
MVPTRQGPLEERLLTLLNQETVTRAEVKLLIEELLSATREDMYYNITFQGRILPSNRTH